MLPEEISNNLCSLNPHEAKKCIIIEAQLYSGQLKSFKIHRGIIKSVGRLTYNQVDDVMFQKKSKANILR